MSLHSFFDERTLSLPSGAAAEKRLGLNAEFPKREGGAVEQNGLAEWQTGPQTQVMSPTLDSTTKRIPQRSTIRWTLARRKRR